MIALDSGGVSGLTLNRRFVEALVEGGLWPALVPSVVLVEALTGDHRRDHAVNRFLKTCVVEDVDESLARSAARLRTGTRRAGAVSAVDATVAAFAVERRCRAVVTSDPRDLTSLLWRDDVAVLAV